MDQYSLALSVKMNILLYAPSFFYLLILNLTPLELMYQVMIMVSVQVSLAFPFLQSYPKEYLGNAFNFSRRFLYEWSVNWQFLSPTTFSSAFFSTMLIFTWCLGTFLLVHLWTQHHHPQNKGLRHVLVPWLQRFFHPRSSSSLSQENKGILPGLSEAHQVYLIFLSHLWGILTSRSLHYQFYSWYAFTVPFLAFKLPYPWVLGTFLISSIEYAWNVYPPNPFSSKVLFGSHLMLFFGGVLFNFLFPSHAQSSSSPTSPSKKIV
ncbi:dolichyl-P-Man:Man(5)GlcNAc(2)-PP-dolichol alpha-1,3-mannosyltransferase [Coelomomyces lativittatus]|nr:dolichyl-P-Man:Man(5)GlcNAc(2)-PP-dolichol alpha-1,3-mannosyltransferase [Coelomomyces lativittatus]